MKALITTDLHLTENSKEAYRWDVFDFLKNALIKHQCTHLFILGDIFDKKDRHPSENINKLVGHLVEIADKTPIYMLCGNHDYYKPEYPFWSFLDYIKNITWIDKPTLINFNQTTTLWLPHSKNPINEWEDFLKNDHKVLFLHQSIIGSQISNYNELNHGLELNWLMQHSKAVCAISGDIHVPQRLKDWFYYVGTPHPVSFGDDYVCKVMTMELIDKRVSLESIDTPTFKRHSLKVRSVEDLESLAKQQVIKPDDQAKLRIELDSTSFDSWVEKKDSILEWCKRNRVDLHDLKVEIEPGSLEPLSQSNKEIPIIPLDVFNQYVEIAAIDADLKLVGLNLLKNNL